mmetsp:Transcript_84061/g.175827  ORF Transcript_84061/g.175827 Transcript_84061/m.175827 type:complete len:109 (+) Transcript_84061:499-825(+)
MPPLLKAQREVRRYQSLPTTMEPPGPSGTAEDIPMDKMVLNRVDDAPLLEVGQDPPTDRRRKVKNLPSSILAWLPQQRPRSQIMTGRHVPEPLRKVMQRPPRPCRLER